MGLKNKFFLHHLIMFYLLSLYKSPILLITSSTVSHNFLFEQSLQLQYKLSQFIDLNISIKSYKIVFFILSPLYISFNIAKIKITIITKNIILTPLNIIITVVL